MSEKDIMSTPLGGGAYERFSEAIALRRPDRLKRDRGIDETMQGITELAQSFASVMIANGMPAEPVIEEHYGSYGYGAPASKLLRTTTHRVWPAVREKNLSGEPMISARIERETHSVSSLSGTHNNYQDHYKPINPNSLSSLRLKTGDNLRYSEKVIAISAMGGLLLLIRRKSYGGSLTGSKPWLSEPYKVSSSEVNPADLFNTEGRRINPRRIIAAMQKRLNETLEEYDDERNEELEDGPVSRQPDYYKSVDQLAPLTLMGIACKPRGWLARHRLER